MFRKTCFGVYLDMPTILIQGRVLHNILMRQVYQEDDDSLHFMVNGVPLRFGLPEFALDSGLRCIGNTSISISSNGN